MVRSLVASSSLGSLEGRQRHADRRAIRRKDGRDRPDPSLHRLQHARFKGTLLMNSEPESPTFVGTQAAHARIVRLQDWLEGRIRREEQQAITKAIRDLLPTDEDCENERELCMAGSGRHWIHACVEEHGIATEVDVDVDNLSIWVWEQIDSARRKALIPAWTTVWGVEARNPTWGLQVGRVKTSPDQVLVLVEHPDVMIFEIDLDSKYPADFMYVTSDDATEVRIVADDKTLNVDHSAAWDTAFILHGTKGWQVFADASRYTVTICAFRRPPFDELYEKSVNAPGKG